jgi:glycosyltransferase involved in cell wall biosynthesis
MKACVCCCTYNRPKQLGHVVRCFERQDYGDREMVILDDAGQYANTTGDRWRLVSVTERYGSLGEKRNACAEMASPDAEVLVVWDDDDLYLPWALSASINAIQPAEWSRPSLVLHPQPNGALRQHLTGGLFHGGWAYRRDVFWRLGGYAAGYSGPEDQELMRRMERAGVKQSDPIALGWRPFYVYPWGRLAGGEGYHISGLLTGRDRGQEAWRKLGGLVIEPEQLIPTDPPDLNLLDPVIEGGVYPRMF